jgi:UDP:flavonoid glycosyltransferase YjiC (YdhE family)
MAHIVMMTKGTGGDLFPYLKTGKALKSRGHEVSLVSHWYNEGKAAGAGLDFLAIDTPEEVPPYEEQVFLDRQQMGESYQDDTVLVPNHSSRQATAGEQAEGTPVISVFGVPIKKTLREFERVSAICRPGETILMSNYTSFTAGQLVAEKLSLPFVSVFMAPGFLPNWIIDLGFFDELYKEVGKDINIVRAELGLEPVRDWRGWLAYADRHLGLWPEWFAPVDPRWPFKVDLVGFIRDDVVTHGELPPEVNEMVERGERPVLISHGTSIPLKRDFFSVAAEACRRLNHPGLIVTKFDMVIPDILPAVVRRFDYLPFGKLMGDMGVIIHHAGIGSCGQAIAAGVPQLVLGHGYDRAENATNLQRLGVAESLTPTRWTVDEVAAALDRLLHSPDIAARCREAAHLTKLVDADGTACDVIERVAASRASANGSAKSRHFDGNGELFTAKKTDEKDDRMRAMMEQLTPEKRALLTSRLKQKLGEALANRQTTRS